MFFSTRWFATEINVVIGRLMRHRHIQQKPPTQHIPDGIDLTTSRLFGRCSAINLRAVTSYLRCASQERPRQSPELTIINKARHQRARTDYVA